MLMPLPHAPSAALGHQPVGVTLATYTRPAPRSRSLTARGVKSMLTRAGVDHSTLTITEHTSIGRRIDFAYTGPWQRITEVHVHGPREDRRAASEVLSERGLSVAPYGDHDEWSRGRS